MKVLVTGAAGFIGFHLCKRLLDEGYSVIGVDNLNAYYDVRLKESRLCLLRRFQNFSFRKADISDPSQVEDFFRTSLPRIVIHLAAQAGVRYSIENPQAYIQSNGVGFLNILEGCRKYEIEHLLYASSSSVYGANTNMPFSVHDATDHPMSLYAATKKSNELMAHAYSSLFQLPTTGLRFFTVYGPWGRPDMALFSFTKSILEEKPIRIFNNGRMKRDFTYITDIIEPIMRLLHKTPQPNKDWHSDHPDPASSYAPYTLYNIGSNRPIDLLTFLAVLEETLDKKAVIQNYPIQSGDVPATYACIDDLTKITGFTPQVTIREGITHFVHWYKEYYGVLYV